MPPARQLSRADEILMICIVVLGDEAFSTTLRAELAKRAGKKITVGSLWVSLDQLAERGLVRKRTAKGENKRGGRPRIYYRLTPRGVRALERAREFQKKLWKNVPDLDEYAS